MDGFKKQKTNTKPKINNGGEWVNRMHALCCTQQPWLRRAALMIQKKTAHCKNRSYGGN